MKNTTVSALNEAFVAETFTVGRGATIIKTGT